MGAIAKHWEAVFKLPWQEYLPPVETVGCSEWIIYRWGRLCFIYLVWYGGLYLFMCAFRVQDWDCISGTN